MSKRGEQSGQCQVCRHPDRARVDYLYAKGVARFELATRFEISRSAVYRHCKNHVSQDFIRSVRIGPFRNEDQLRKLCAEHGASVLDGLRAIYGALADRFLVAYEAGADDTLGKLTGRLHDNLELQARLTKELAPTPTMAVQNVFMLPDFARLQQALIRITAGHPEVRAEIVRELKQIADRPAPIEVAEAAVAGRPDFSATQLATAPEAAA